MKYYSRRQLEALGEPLGESVTQTKPGGHGRIYGAGGGSSQPTETKVTNTNLPDYLQPQVEAGIGALTQELFTTREIPGKAATYDEFGNELTPAEKSTFEITGVKPFTPYSTNMQDYFAGFSPLQQQVQYEAAGMQRPGQFGPASQMSMGAGMGGMDSARQAYGYGGMGAGYGAQAAGIGQQGLGYQGYGADIGRQAMGYGQQAAGMGGLYEQMATSPEAMQAYMSPYTRNVIEQQKESAIRDAQKANLAQNLGAARQGTYGGSRQLLAQTERERALGSQLGQIEAQGLQDAYRQAQQAQQFGITSGLQGLQGAQQGLGTALQGGQLGIQGIQQALAGQQAGMQGAQVGLQGVSGAQAGYGLGGQQAATLANIAQQQQAADIARMQFQGEQGSAQQQMEQNLINQAIQNYAMAQQYPAQQLSLYNAMLRGYATPTTTVSQYQAAPSAASQMAGMTTATAALAGLAKKKGGKIKDEDGIDEILIQKTLKRASK